MNTLLIGSPLDTYDQTILSQCNIEQVVILGDLSKDVLGLNSLKELPIYHFSNLVEVFNHIAATKLQQVVFIIASLEIVPILPAPTIRVTKSSDLTGLSTSIRDILYHRSTAILIKDPSLYAPNRFLDVENKIFSIGSSLSPETKLIEDLRAFTLGRFYPLTRNTNVRFRVVTPSFNQGQYIDRAIKSVLSQSYKNFDYVVIDGASSDSTVSILETYKDQLSWVSEKDKGYAEAVNKGFENSKADYFVWLPADDIFFDQYVLQRFASAIEEKPADVFYGDAIYCDENAVCIGFYPTKTFSAAAMKESCFICQPATVFSGKLFRKVGGLNTNYRSIADYDLWLKMIEQNATFEHLGYVTARYTLQPNSITVKNKFTTYKEIFEMQLGRYGRVSPEWINGAMYLLREKRMNTSTFQKLSNKPMLTKKSLKQKVRSLAIQVLSNQVFIQRIILRMLSKKT